jgi:hypothetical protein
MAQHLLKGAPTGILHEHCAGYPDVLDGLSVQLLHLPGGYNIHGGSPLKLCVQILLTAER